MKRKISVLLAVVLSVVLLGAAGCWYYVQTRSFMETAGRTAASVASEALGVQVEVGDIQVQSLHDLEIHHLAVYDKQAECIARAEKARVSFRLFSVFSQPSDVVKEVVLSDVAASVVQRPDGSWNVQDLMTDQSSGQEFHGLVRVEKGSITASAQGKTLQFDDVNGALDFSDYPVMKLQASAGTQGTNLTVSGTLDSSRQILSVQADDLDIQTYLPLLPDGILPEQIVPAGGSLSDVSVHFLRDGSRLSFSGETDFHDGRIQVGDMEVSSIDGHISFTDQEALLSLTAECAGQRAGAHGRLYMDTGEPYLDLEVSSDSFDPGRILKNIPWQGAAAFDAKLTGPCSDPTVTGTVRVGDGAFCGVPVRSASAQVRYQDGNVFVQKLHAGICGGTVEGEAAVAASSLAYTAHIKASGIDLSQTADYVPELSDLSGRAAADVGLSGVGTGRDELQAYGSLSLSDGTYRSVPFESLNTSFYLADDNLVLDFLSMNLPGRSRLGIEGTISSVMTHPVLDLAYYGAHFDLSLLSQWIPDADVTGLGDFKGTVHGAASNPQVDIKFSGLKGTLFKQPFDSLKLAASGSLDGVGIDDFLMECGGREVWRVAGTVGFTGDRRINLQIDTMGARMEDIAALIAPDQPVTGNVDNIIKFTGTLDNPKGVGYIHFYRGSYRGVLLSGMDGDYFLENGVVRLQDFHTYSPMTDMVLNGTIDREKRLNLEVVVRDIDLKRIEHKLPYEVSGHGTFRGVISGNIDAPEFHGVLDAPSLTMNGQDITNLHGQVEYQNGVAVLDRFGFEQNGGSFDVIASVNTETKALSGNVVVQNADVNAIAALLNQKNELVQGRLDSGAEISGTWDNPTIGMQGELKKGTVGGYDVHDVQLDIRLMNHILFINKMSGAQGERGLFEASGTADLNDGPIDVRLQATDLALGMFARTAGINAEVIGTADVQAVFGGTVSNPSADVVIAGRDGGVRGSTFDRLDGSLHLKNGMVTVDSVDVRKTVGGREYHASAKGVMPYRALGASADEQLDDIEQIRMTVALDQADLSLLPALSDHVDWAVGPTTGTLKVRGTLAHPLIDGTLGITDGAVKIKELEKPVTNMNLRMLFAGDKMTVQDFSGKMGNGTYSLTGSLQLDGITPGHYAFDFSADRLDVQSSFFRGPLTAELHVADTDFFGHHMPKLSGQIDFRDCLVSVPSIPDGDSSLPEAMMDVQVHVGDKVHFYSAYLYDLYLTGTFHAGGLVSHPKMSGSLHVRRGGTINYLKTEFKIREGIANFDQVDSFLPSIDFSADTRLTQAKVFLSAKGPLGKMELRLTSSPEMSQTQIIQMLTLRNAYKTGKNSMDAGDLLAVGLQMSFLSEVEDVMRNVLFLDQFTISRGSGSAFDRHTEENDTNQYDFNVRMGKYISDKVMIKYTRSLGAANVNRYGIQYDVNDRLGLTLDREGGSYIVGLEARTSF